MENLADIALDLICALKFAPPDGYEKEDLDAMENACWQTMLHSLSEEEYAAIVAAAKRQMEELEFDPFDDLPDYLQEKYRALQSLAVSPDDCTDPQQA